MTDLHKEWDTASAAERAAAATFDKAQRAMWNAEHLWDCARERAQRAYLALSRALEPKP